MISLRDVVTGFGNRDPLAEVWRRDLRGGGSSAEITGTLPLSFSGRGKPLTDYMIYGNTIQNGTPTPEAPVDVVGCGVRTEQIFEDKIIGCSIDGAGKLVTNPDFDMYIAKVEQGVIYTASARITGGFYTAKPVIGSVSYNGQRVAFVPETITAPITGYMVFRVNSGSNEPMLNLGSTALPYEPYGYKLPPTVNGTEYPIYLGEVESTRKIRKLVLTGMETNWNVASTSLWHLRLRDMPAVAIADSRSLYCTHYNGVASKSTYSGLTNGNACIFNNDSYLWIRDQQFTSLTNFKNYLYAQYANGTPVTVWYVLAEPETAIVNEPLMKIGNYADTISFAQAGVTIPTVSGANVLDMTSPVKPSEVYIKGNGIKPTNDPNFENGG